MAASILGIELDGKVGRKLVGESELVRVQLGTCKDRFFGHQNTASLHIMADLGEILATVRSMADTESEAIAALEAKVKRLPGVLAVLNGKDGA